MVDKLHLTDDEWQRFELDGPRPKRGVELQIMGQG